MPTDAKGVALVAQIVQLGRRRGRPPIREGDRSIPVSVALPSRDYDRVYQRASQQRVKVPELIRRVVLLHLGPDTDK
jgi:hypothetical protein